MRQIKIQDVHVNDMDMSQLLDQDMDYWYSMGYKYGEIEGSVEEKRRIVGNLLRDGTFSDWKIAELTDVPIFFVWDRRKEVFGK